MYLIMMCRLANGHWHRLPGSGTASLSMQAMHCITSCNLACIVPVKVVNYMGFLLEINRRLLHDSRQMHFFFPFLLLLFLLLLIEAKVFLLTVLRNV